MISVLYFMLFTLLLTSCDSTTPTNKTSFQANYKLPQNIANLVPINHSIATTGCGVTPTMPLGTSVTQTVAAHPAESEGHTTRSYILHVPSSYQVNKSDALVLVFHGFGGTAAGMERSSGFTPLAEQHGFIVAYLQGLPDGDNGPPFWAEVGPMDYGVDDVLFVSDLISKLQSTLCIDTHRIYATGFSDGGGMTGYLACRLSGRIAAFAPMSGNFYDAPGGCHPPRPVPIVDFHGLLDTVLPYNGIPITTNPSWPLTSIPQWLQGWAMRDGCTQGPTIILKQSNVTGEQWSNCQGNATLVHYRFQGGHSFPPMIQGKSGAEVAWQFFEAHTLG